MTSYKILMALVFLLSIVPTRALVYNCTANESVVIPDCICTPGECPECPILPNETIIIQNLTLPDLKSPNVTCSYDTSDFIATLDELSDEKDEWMHKYTTCDSNLTKGRLYERELTEKQNEINSCRAELDKKEEEKNTYLLYGAIGAGLVAYFLYQRKVTPSAVKRLERE